MSVHEKILKWLENGLFEGTLRLGQDLPDDRRIAAVIGSSNSSTREALKTLETMGIVRLYEGKRKTIITHLTSSPLASAGSALRLHMADARHPIRDAVETQILLESWAVTRENPPQSAIEGLENIVEAMLVPSVLPQDFHALEVEFHIALTKLSGNHMVVAMMTTMHDTLLDTKIEMLGRVPLWSNFATRARAEYQAILGAVKSGDRELAARLVLENITGQYEEANLDLDEETLLANALPGTPKPAVYFEPVEVDTDDLIPEEWNETGSLEAVETEDVVPEETEADETDSPEEETDETDLEAPEDESAAEAEESEEEAIVEPSPVQQPEPVSLDLLTALQNIQPVGVSSQAEQPVNSDLSEPQEEAPAAEEPEMESSFSPQETEAEATLDEEPATEQQPFAQQPFASTPEVLQEEDKDTIVRAPGLRNRRLRGRVTTPVHATVIQPRPATAAQSVVASGILSSEEELPSQKTVKTVVSAEPNSEHDVVRAVPRAHTGKTLTGAPAPASSADEVVETAAEEPKKSRSLLGRLFGIDDSAPRKNAVKPAPVTDSVQAVATVHEAQAPEPVEDAPVEPQKTRAQLRAEAKQAAAERKAAAKAEARRRKEEERAEIERLAAEQTASAAESEPGALPEGYEVYEGDQSETVYEDEIVVEDSAEETDAIEEVSAADTPAETEEKTAPAEQPDTSSEKRSGNVSGSGNALNKNKKKKKKKRR